MEQCINCKFLKPITGGCMAYPYGIPYKFSSEGARHTKVEKGQKGMYVFEKGEPEELKGIKAII